MIRLETSKSVFIKKVVDGIQYLIEGSKIDDSVEIEIETHIPHLDLPNGTAHFLEHLTIGNIVFEMKQENPSVRLNGHASYNRLVNLSAAFSYKNDTFVGYRTPDHIVIDCFDFVDRYLSNVLCNRDRPITQEALDKERGIIMAEYKQQVVPLVDCAQSVAPIVSWMLMDDNRTAATSEPFALNYKSNTIGSEEDIMKNITLEHVNTARERSFNKNNTLVRIIVPIGMIANSENLSDDDVRTFMENNIPKTYKYIRDMKDFDGAKLSDDDLNIAYKESEDYIFKNISDTTVLSECNKEITPVYKINTPLMIDKEKFLVIALEDPSRESYSGDGTRLSVPSLKKMNIDYLIGIYCMIRTKFGEIYSPVPIHSVNSSYRFISNKRLFNGAVAIGLSLTRFSDEQIDEIVQFISDYNQDYINNMDLDKLSSDLEMQLTETSDAIDAVILQCLDNNMFLFDLETELKPESTAELFAGFNKFISRDRNTIADELKSAMNNLRIFVFKR